MSREIGLDPSDCAILGARTAHRRAGRSCKMPARDFVCAQSLNRNAKARVRWSIPALSLRGINLQFVEDFLSSFAKLSRAA